MSVDTAVAGLEGTRDLAEPTTSETASRATAPSSVRIVFLEQPDGM
ncbi:hypothetical protein GZL_02526 [Streptomyces sp. 769]|nr:hypothetical protein GZL_02526 [Streptomyces sp. 769]